MVAMKGKKMAAQKAVTKDEKKDEKMVAMTAMKKVVWRDEKMVELKAERLGKRMVNGLVEMSVAEKVATKAVLKADSRVGMMVDVLEP